MCIATKILNQVTVLIICLRREEHPACFLFQGHYRHQVLVTDHWSEGIPLQELCTRIKNTPLLLVITGYGVISKECGDGTGVESRIVGNNEFLWSYVSENESVKQLTFVRRTQITPLLEILKAKKCLVAETRIEQQKDNESLLDMAVKQSHFVLTGNQIAAFMAIKLRLPLLLLLLLLLGINVPINRSLLKKCSRQQQEYARLQGIVAERRSWSEKTEHLFREFRESEDWQPCLLADRIASLVPETLVLEGLVVNPLKKQPEELKPLQMQRNVLVEGYSAETAGITVFTRRLADYNPSWEVQLISLNRSEEKDVFKFKIMITRK